MGRGARRGARSKNSILSEGEAGMTTFEDIEAYEFAHRKSSSCTKDHAACLQCDSKLGLHAKVCEVSHSYLSPGILMPSHIDLWIEGD